MKDENIKKVLLLGSGALKIGEAGEFDYSGSQALKALREEGVQTVLINPNIATVQTSEGVADQIYFLPVQPYFVEEVIKKERPDGILLSFGGQTALNCGVELYRQGILEKYNVKVLGTPVQAIMDTEDRELFVQKLDEINVKTIKSEACETIEQTRKAAAELGYPVIIRAAYALGGLGSGFADNEEELNKLAEKAFSFSPQVLVEKSLKGWKEIEYEVVRDRYDNCITVCNMENFDPVGVHTGDSIVVAPSQTLTDHEYQMLRSASLRIIRELGIEGGCNAQYALDPNSNRYYVIEVNPRVSRSSALASKATGYPIAKVSAKIAIGYTLDEITNAVTQKTKACFEPALDYCVVKFPRWPFDKFVYADRTLGTQMKATGEVMSIDRHFEGAILKAARSLEIGVHRLHMDKMDAWDDARVKKNLARINDERIFVIAEALRRGIATVDEIHDITKVDKWFLYKIQNIATIENKLKDEALTPSLMLEAKNIGLADRSIAEITGKTADEVRTIRKTMHILPKYKMVDTCAAEFEAATPYYYSTFQAEEDEVRVSDARKVIVLGSGPIRIGQGVEFDYCSVHSVWALREMGIEAIIINNNPETVSTDFDISDRLYFEPLTTEDVLNIIDKEKPEGVIVQFGGQTAINLAASLQKAGVKVFGTSVDDIDRAEDRERFDEVLTQTQIPRPQGISVTNLDDAVTGAAKIGYPVMVRPSYVLGGRAMEIVYNEAELRDYMSRAVKVTPDHPVLVDRYMQGTEVEVDGISDGVDVVIPGIMEHVERAGVHSGDSIAVYPPQTLSSKVIYTIIDYTKRLALSLHVKGLLNIQFVVVDGEVYIIEVNPRSSRTVPFLSKVTNVDMVGIATRIAMGHTLKELGYKSGLVPPKPYVAVKAPVFSFAKMTDVDIALGPEMKSTGEVMGIDYHYARALYKAIIGSGIHVPTKGCILFTVADKDKEEMKQLAKAFAELGFEICATEGTAKAIQSMGIDAEVVGKVHERSSDIIQMIKNGKINMVINTLTQGKHSAKDGFKIRRATVEHGIACLTSLDTAWEVLRVLSFMRERRLVYSLAIQDYVGGGDDLA